MTKTLVFIILFGFYGCQEKYDIYHEKAKVCALMKFCDEQNKTASIEVYDYSDVFYDENKSLNRIKHLSKFYNIEGYSIFIYEGKLGVEPYNQDKFTKQILSDKKYGPYEYKKHYIVNNDTILHGLYRFQNKAYLFSEKIFSSKDSALLLRAFESMGLSHAYLFNNKGKYEKAKSWWDKETQSYIMYQKDYSTHDLFFLDERHDGEHFSIDGIYVHKMDDSEYAKNYRTSDYLDHKQMLKIYKDSNLTGKQNMIRFYQSEPGSKDYGSIMLWNKKDYFVYLLYKHKRYYFTTETGQWSLKYADN